MSFRLLDVIRSRGERGSARNQFSVSLHQGSASLRPLESAERPFSPRTKPRLASLAVLGERGGSEDSRSYRRPVLLLLFMAVIVFITVQPAKSRKL